jgi:glyceraldehyde-3-phosphate dehydrogenase/erythrose-4-phosphate dehydrogenase
MTVRVAINGFGRTGRCYLRAVTAPAHRFEIVAFNDLGSPVAHGNLVKVLGWYDNESGYSSRLADLAAFVGGAPGR